MTDPQLNFSTAFIGAGNMATSIIGGMVKRGFAAPAITAANPSNGKLEALASRYGIHTTNDNQRAAKADVVVLAVKPQLMKQVCESLRPALSHRPLIISVAAGIPVSSYERWLGEEHAIVRSMPNTPSLVQAGAAGLFANGNTSERQKEQASAIASACGLALWVEREELIDAVIAVSGSGPAYYFLVMEAMIEAGIRQGLAPDTARQLTLQTALGAAQMAISSDVEPAELRRRVCSPGGTTEQAILSFEQQGLRKLFDDAMSACANRAREMAKEMGDV